MAGMEALREQERARPLQTSTQRNTASSAGGVAVGEALGGLGRAVGGMAEAIGARDVLLADTEAREANLAYMRDRNDYLYAPTTGIMNQRGGNGVDIIPEASEGLRALQDKHAANLSPIARRRFEESVEQSRVEDEGGIARYSSAQTEQYVNSGREATISSTLEAATLAYKDPVLFEQNVDKARNEIAAMGELNGWAPEKVQLEQDKATSSALMARIVRTGVDDPLAAEAMLNANRDRLSADHQHTLDTGMQDAVATAKARGVVADYIGPPGMTPAAQRGRQRTGSEAMIVKAESGGRNDAKNPGSSAAGPHQFLSGTFVGQVRKLRAKGGAKWAEGMSDAQIAAVRMPQGAQQEAWEQEVYDDFKADNTAAIQRVGAPVNVVTEYVMHHFGEGNGPKILKAWLTNPAVSLAKVITNVGGLKAVNPWMKNVNTVGQLVDGAARFVGADPRSATGNFVDVQGATTAILGIEDPLVQQKAIAQLNQMMALEANAKQALSEQSFTAAWEDYKINGTTEIPLDLQLAMGPGKLAALQETIAKETSGALATDIDTYEGLSAMASTDPEAFAKEDLSYYYPDLTEADRRRFIDKQVEIKGVLAGEVRKQADPKSLDHDANWKSVEDIVDMAGFKIGAKDATRDADLKRRFNLRRQFEQWQTDFVLDNKRHPTRVELQDAARELVTPVIIGGGGLFGGGDKGIFADTAMMEPGQTMKFNIGITDIPPDEKASIAAQLQANGVAVNSETMLAAAIERRQLALRGGVDSVKEVPPEARSALKYRALPDGGRVARTDAEIVILYNEYMVAQAQEALQIDAAVDSDPPTFLPYLPSSVIGADDDQPPEVPVGTSPFGAADTALVSPAGLGVTSGDSNPTRPADLDYPFEE